MLTSDYTTSKTKVGNPRPNGKDIITQENMGLMIEDFFANGLSIRNLACKYKICESSVSKYLTPMFYKRLTQETKIITLKSKV